MKNISTKQLIGSYYIRYDKLYELITQNYIGSTAEEIDLYIDISPLIRQLLGDMECTEKDSIIIASSLYNMCAHYRNFFKTRFGVYVRIFMVTSTFQTPVNQKYVPYYSNKPEQIGKSLPVIESAFELLDLLCKYTQDVYLIQTVHEAAVAILDCINDLWSTEKNHSPNLILTRDLYDYQLVSDDPDIKILRPKKTQNNDASYMVDTHNLFSILLWERKIKFTPQVNTFSPLLISHIINRINTNLLVKNKKLDSYLIECRTNAIDAWNMYNALSETKVPISNKNLINLYDPKGLKEIADKYFDQNNKLDITVF